MGSSNLKLKNFAGDPPPIMTGGSSGRPPGGNNLPLTRQSSVYSLTFDEFQSAVGGSSGKDLGSMSMDELLKSIWSAEENQNLGSISGGGGGGAMASGHQEGGGSSLLQKQGSFTLPRTLSQRTVEEVWRDMAKDYDVVPGLGAPQREPTLGEVTVEEFLVRAGVVREEAHMAVEPNNNLGFLGDFPNPTLENMGLGFGFQQQQQQQHRELGIKSSGRVPALQLQQQQQQILPKQPVLAFGASAGIPTNHPLTSPRVRIPEMVQTAALGMSGLGPNGVVGVTTSPTEGLAKNGNGDTSAVSPIPYLFNGGIRGRKSAALEKVIERRQRRMIKNRESAARSRARKQAYTMELEAEVAKLKEENEELQKKQAKILEIQKNQELEMMNQQNGPKRQCLRRTLTGPW